MLPNGDSTPAGILVRGFRCVLRVKQLDPISEFYNSIEHAEKIHSFLEGLDALAALLPESAERVRFQRSLRSFAGGALELRRILWPSYPSSHTEARAMRRWLIAAYSPQVVDVAISRLAANGEDVGTAEDDPRASFGGHQRESGLAPHADYVLWCATQLGRQAAIWRRGRFLHDYHVPGLSRYNGLFTLVEQNVTLMAEFPDLDTGVFVEDNEDAEELQLSAKDVALLRSGYEDYHAREVTALRQVLRSLVLAIFPSDVSQPSRADRALTLAYAKGLGSFRRNECQT